MKRFLNISIALSFVTNSTLAFADASCEAIVDSKSALASHGTSENTFRLDKATVADLGLINLTHETLKKNLVTELGQERLATLLKNPLLNSEMIQTRQAAIQLLADQPELRKKIRSRLESLRKSYLDYSAEFLDLMATDQSKKPTGGQFRTSAIAFTALAAGAAYLAVDSEAWRLAAGAVMPLMMFSSHNAGRMRSIGQSMTPLKALAKSSVELENILKQTPSAHLKNLAGVFKAMHDPQHPLQVAGVSRSLRRMIMNNEAVALLGGLTYTLNGPLARMRDKVLAHREGLEILLSTVAELDVVAGLAELLDNNRSTYSMPEILSESSTDTYLFIEEGHHPYVLNQIKEKSVANGIEMKVGANGIPSFLLLTGPNTGGKSTYLRMLATNVIMAQIGGPVAAKRMVLTPVSLMTNMNVQDALDKSQSFFFAEAARVEHILKTAKSQKHMLIIMDEILNGTSPEEHTAIERSIIKFLVQSRYLSILATHDRKLQAMEQEIPGVVNIHVDDKAKDTFTIKKGPSLNRNAVQVLREVGFPAEIVNDSDEYLRSIGIESSARPK